MSDTAIHGGKEDTGADTERWLRERIAELEAEVERMENLLAEGIHTCNPTCKRPLCVLRRENKALREAIQAVVQERSWNAIDKAEALLEEGGDDNDGAM